MSVKLASFSFAFAGPLSFICYLFDLFSEPLCAFAFDGSFALSLAAGWHGSFDHVCPWSLFVPCQCVPFVHHWLRNVALRCSVWFFMFGDQSLQRCQEIRRSFHYFWRSPYQSSSRLVCISLLSCPLRSSPATSAMKCVCVCVRACIVWSLIVNCACQAPNQEISNLELNFFHRICLHIGFCWLFAQA